MKLSIGFGALVLVTSLVACSDSGSDSEGSIENKTVSGVSQKGPFLNGSTVTLHELDGEWRKLTYDEETHGICTVECQNEIFADLLYNEYRNPFFRYYMCDNGDWVTVTTLKANTVGMTCLTDGSIQDGLQDSLAKYVCDDSIFREATEQKISYGKGCVSYLEGEKITVEEVPYTCESGIWK